MHCPTDRDHVAVMLAPGRWRCLDCGAEWGKEREPRPFTPRPIRGAEAALWVVILAVGAIAECYAPERDPGFRLSFFGWLVAAVVAGFQWLAGTAASVAVSIAQCAIMIGQALSRFGGAVAAVFGKTYGYLQTFWRSALRPFVTTVWRAIDRFTEWLRATLGPVLEAIERVRSTIQQYYNDYVKPWLDILDAVRATLRVLGLFRFEWARKLDAELGRIESRIVGPLRIVMTRINEVADIVNRIMTLDGLLQRATLLKSIWKHQRDVLAVWWNAVHRPMTDAQREAADAEIEAATPRDVGEQISAVIAGNAEPSPLVAEYAADIRRILAA